MYGISRSCAARAGRFVVPDARKLAGRFVKKGDLLGYVIAPIDPDVRAVVPQADIDLVRQRARSVAVRFTERVDDSVPARILRQTPAALEKAPAPALTQDGGGPILLDPSSPNHDRPLERFYQVELARARPHVLMKRIGSRVYVRFDHGEEADRLARACAARARCCCEPSMSDAIDATIATGSNSAAACSAIRNARKRGIRGSMKSLPRSQAAVMARATRWRANRLGSIVRGGQRARSGDWRALDDGALVREARTVRAC